MKENSVIVIDDSSIDRKMIKWLLEDKLDSIKVFESDSGKDVIEKIIKNHIKTCILDIKMPKEDGYQVLEKLKNKEETKDVPVIICTGINDMKGIEKALTLGALDYFSKPLSEEVVKISLPLKVKNAIELHKSRLEIKYLSYHDKLTGLYNRRYVENQLEIINKYNVNNIGIIIGDINGLKLTNDIFGHEKGDEILIHVSEILKNNCNEKDVLARWGGDEFIIINYNSSEREVAHLHNHIIKKVKEFNQKGLFEIEISISLGYEYKNKNSNIRNIVKKADDHMYKHKLLESKSYRSSLVNSLQETLLEKSHETSGHVLRMAEFSEKIALKLNLPKKDIDSLYLLSMLHDIGKIVIPDSILTKKGKLDRDEWHEMKKHPEIGFRIAKASPELSQIAEYILCHHERWDGKGYPQGLKGNEIPLLSRIVSVIDSYDAMTNERPYSKKKSKKDAINELKKESGKQFDPDIVETFLSLF